MKLVPWTHTFVCLAAKDTDSVPTDYALLTANGLGKEKIHLFETSTAMEIHDAILSTFPKLVDAGGYDFLRTSDNSKQLRVIVPPADGYTGLYLKSILGQAKCFIHPIIILKFKMTSF